MTRRELLALVGAASLSRVEMAEGHSARKAPVEGSDPAERRELLYSLLGDLPSRDRPIASRVIREERGEKYILEVLELDLNGIEPVPAFVTRPLSPGGAMPAVLYNHSHGGGYKIGKKELLEGREYLSRPPYAEALSELGYLTLCIDSWVFGERSHTSEMDMFKAMLWQGQVLWGMMVYDGLRSLDYLAGRADVDATRLATLGISMGSTMAWWLAALDERLKVTVDICCLTDFQSLLRRKALSEHGVYYYVPSLLKYFTTAEINALIAPRPHLGLAGIRDPLTPVEGLDVIDGHLKRVYADHGVPEHWRLLRYDVAHQETAEGRQEILRFLQRFL